MLAIVTLTLGPVETNAYLIADQASGEAAVIDPAWEGATILAEAARCGWRIGQLWVTHAHFDHFGGTAALASALHPPADIALHPADLFLWQMQGGAAWFGLPMEAAPQPTVLLRHGQSLKVGRFDFEIRHTPGHTPGHVVYYCRVEGIAFCGDVIFAGGIGRTDLPGGDEATLLDSIRSQILTLPEETRLLSGHGASTTVGNERRNNPFLR